MNPYLKGALIASAVAGLMGTVGCAGGTGTTTDPLVKCGGLHDCTGKSQCKGESPDGTVHDCAGKGTCKDSVQYLKKSECTSKNGTDKGPAPTT